MTIKQEFKNITDCKDLPNHIYIRYLERVVLILLKNNKKLSKIGGVVR